MLPQSNVFKLQRCYLIRQFQKCEKWAEVPRVRANLKDLRAEVRKLGNTQKTLHNALRLLFELLEEYSPMWYQKHNHDQAKTALERVERIRIE
jgi:hypothetical protein